MLICQAPQRHASAPRFSATLQRRAVAPSVFHSLCPIPASHLAYPANRSTIPPCPWATDRKDMAVKSRTIVLETEVPEDIYLTLRARGLFRETLAEQSRRLLALRYYRDRILSLGKAARLADMTRWEFIDFLAENDVPVIDLSDEELEAEVAAVDELETELRR